MEVSNRTILQGLKKRIEDIPRSWVDELPNVLWSYRTTPRSTTGESPFRMAYGIEAVSPAEVSLSSPRIKSFDLKSSLVGIKLHNDLIEETRENVATKVRMQQQKMATYFNKRVKVKKFFFNKSCISTLGSWEVVVDLGRPL